MNEIKEKMSLLNEKGALAAKGFAKRLVLQYDRAKIKASKHRIKEWDYYLISNGKYALALTIDDNSYMGLDSISLIDLENVFEITKSEMQGFTFGRKKLPPTSETGDVASYGKTHFIKFENDGKTRKLTFCMMNFKDSPIFGEVLLENSDDESMVIATPFDGDEKAFYYNQKINCLRASGKFTYAGKDYVFDKEDSFAVLDWGRGVWTYKNTWYWSSASYKTESGDVFGFNLGYGFGNTDAATENMLFCNGRAHKLSHVNFNIPQKDGRDDFMSDWSFTSDDGRFEMSFHPVIDRASKTDVLLICSDQHQVFGKFTGYAILNDGKKIEVKDFPGFAEKVKNKW